MPFSLKSMTPEIRAILLTILVASWALVPDIAAAQDETTNATDNPAPPPTLRDFSLPPGRSQTPQAPSAEGPVEENGTPPRPANRPQATPPRPATNPVQSRPVPEPQPAEPLIAPRQPRAAEEGVPATRPSSGRSQPARTETSTPAAASPDQQTETSPDEAAPQEDTALPSSDNAANAAPAGNGNVTTSPAAGTKTGAVWPWIAGFAALSMLSLWALFVYLTRRRQSHNADDTDTPWVAEAGDEPLSPPADAKPIITQKDVQSPARNIAPATASSRISLDFTALEASCTLINAVVKYQVTLDLDGASPDKITIFGALLQADVSSLKAGDALDMPLLHTLEVKGQNAANGIITLDGDLRLALSAIDPIIFNQQALFIPLARFMVRWMDAHGNTHQVSKSFLVGREHEPPRPKMAPLRLDLGPRSFKPVGQRALEPA